MTIEKLEEFLNEGEGYTLEYKESVNSPVTKCRAL